MREFHYTVECLPGMINKVPNCMSRLRTGTMSLVNGTLEYAGAFATERSTPSMEFEEHSMIDKLKDHCVQCGSGLKDDALGWAACGKKWH